MNVPSLLNDPVSPVWPLSSSPSRFRAREVDRAEVVKDGTTFENKIVGAYCELEKVCPAGLLNVHPLSVIGPASGAIVGCRHRRFTMHAPVIAPRAPTSLPNVNGPLTLMVPVADRLQRSSSASWRSGRSTRGFNVRCSISTLPIVPAAVPTKGLLKSRRLRSRSAKR